MEMKQYLIDTFKFNDLMNTKLLAKIKALPDQQQCIRFFSHLINSQKKWMARIIWNRILSITSGRRTKNSLDISTEQL